MNQFKHYRKKQVAEMRPYVAGEDMTDINVTPTDAANGSPKEGDMVARNTVDHSDQWLVSAKFFEENYKLI
jgi:hypothetical protein